MIIRWPWLLLAVAFLAPPPLLSSELRRLVISTRRNAGLSVVSLIRPWQNWVDLVRAMLGTWILTQMAFLPDPAKDILKRSGSKLLLAEVVVLAVVLFFQVLRIDLKAARSEQKMQLLAPVFYLCGITFVLSGLPGAFAVFVGWIFAISAKNPAYQLPAMGAGLLAGGYVFGLSLPLLCNVALILLPFSEAFAFRKRLVFVGLEPRFGAPLLKTT